MLIWTIPKLVNYVNFALMLKIQGAAGGTPSGDRVKLSYTKTKKKKKLDMSYIHGKLRFLWFQLCKPF